RTRIRTDRPPERSSDERAEGTALGPFSFLGPISCLTASGITTESIPQFSPMTRRPRAGRLPCVRGSRETTTRPPYRLRRAALGGRPFFLQQWVGVRPEPGQR